VTDHTALPLVGTAVVGSRRQGVAGWVAAAASAAVVLVTIGGVALLLERDLPATSEPTVTMTPQPVTTTVAEPVVPTTTPIPTTIAALMGSASGDWVAFGADAGLPGTPTDAVAVDDFGDVWVLADTDDPATAQLYSLDVGDRAFVARGEPLTLAGDWYTLWMEATTTGIVMAIDQIPENGDGPMPPERLLQWDAAGWHDLSGEYDLPDLRMSVAQRSSDGNIRVAGYTYGSSPVGSEISNIAVIDIASAGVTYLTAPEGACCRGTPSPFTVGHAVVPIGPDGRSWFSNGEDGVVALGVDGYEAYDAETASGCCFVPLAADATGVWAYFGRDMYRYDASGWGARASVPLIPHVALVVAMVVTADGELWVLGQNSSAQLDIDASDTAGDESWTVTGAQGADMPRISFQSTITRDGDAVWVASWRGGLTIWQHDGHEWALVNLPDTMNQDGTGFMQNTVVAGNGALWVATSTGVERFSPTP
jgi:hypothetical protein